ncbi:SLATT domain-containing protein [Novosphingobium flavum]|nr:SLATT domain-containing protein [Novosphingobium aerophilum]
MPVSEKSANSRNHMCLSRSTPFETASYSQEGERLTALFYRLRDLYRDVQATAEGVDLAAYRVRLDAIQAEVFGSNQSKQILFSDWYAHYKFFWQQQIEWIDEQKEFTLWRDKVPLSFSFTLAVSVLALVALGIIRVT